MLMCASGYGTNLEGPWDAVMMVSFGRLLRGLYADEEGDWGLSCGSACHGYTSDRRKFRVNTTSSPTNSDQTDIRIGTRTDKSITSGGNAGKVQRVEEILGRKA